MGRLLHLLAAQRGRSRAAEVGSGCGVGTAWLAAGLPPGVPLYTTELDATRAAAVRELFAADDDVHVLEGDWRETLPPEAPFDLVFLDGGHWKQEPYEAGDRAVGLLAPGGILIADDFTPGRPGPDPAREFVFGHPLLFATEILVTPASAALLAVRTR